DSESLPTRGQHSQLRGCVEQLLGDGARLVEQVFAIVQKDERAHTRDVAIQGLPERCSRYLARTHRRHNHLQEACPVRHWRHLHEPDPVRKIVEDVFRKLERQPRLPAAAHTRKRQETLLKQELPTLGKILFSTDEALQLTWQVVGDVSFRSRLRASSCSA